MRPWKWFLVLFALFSVLGPYDVNNRRDHEGQNADLKNTVSGQNAGIEEGHADRRVAVIGLALVALALAWRTRRARLRGLPLPPTPPWDPYPVVPSASGTHGDRTVALPIVAFLLFAMASIGWADDPPLVARRVVVFLSLCFAAWAIGRSWRLSDILVFTIVSCGITLAASVALDVAHGAFHPFDGAWRLSGLAHPNRHAQEGAVVIMASLAAARLDPAHRRRYFMAAICAGVIILLTRSRTSAVAIVFALGCASLYVMPRRKAVGLGIAMTAIGIAAVVFGPDLLDSARHALLFGRQASTADVGTLSGRTELWRELLTYVGARPLAGYGFQGFWSPEHTAEVSLKLGWVVPTAHNGYLDILLTVGLIGLALFVIALAAGIAHAARRLSINRGDVDALCTLTVLAWVAVELMSESVLPETHYSAFLAMILLARQAATSPVVARARTRVYAPTPSASLTV